jgi:hypothetical protein
MLANSFARRSRCGGSMCQRSCASAEDGVTPGPTRPRIGRLAGHCRRLKLAELTASYRCYVNEGSRVLIDTRRIDLPRHRVSTILCGRETAPAEHRRRRPYAEPPQMVRSCFDSNRSCSRHQDWSNPPWEYRPSPRKGSVSGYRSAYRPQSQIPGRELGTPVAECRLSLPESNQGDPDSQEAEL